METNPLSALKHMIGLGQTPTSATNQNTDGLNNVGKDVKKSEETYFQYGVRLAGIHSGGLIALNPSMLSVISAEKYAQGKDAAKQEAYKKTLENEKQQKEAEIRTLELQNKKKEDEIKTLQDKIVERQKEINALINDKKVDKMARLNFYISLGIVILLTIYLFVFYSSTTYSAIYMSGSQVIDDELSSHIFNPKALSLAYSQSLFALLLVLLLPVIFLGLGFLIHQFSQDKGFGKYIKVGSLVAVNFIFDAILAYLISKKMYDLWAASQLEMVPPYSVNLAKDSADFWLVIFAGFIAYLIWGLVFSSMMDTYGKMISNKHLIDAVQKEIDNDNKAINDAKNIINSNNQKSVQLNADIHKIDNSIANGITVDYTQIKKCLEQFFNGWLAYMNGVGASSTDKANAQNQFNNLISSLQ